LLTVLALAYEEPVRVRCCNFQPALWNEVQREYATAELTRARLAVDDESVELTVLPYAGANGAEAVARRAAGFGAERIVVPGRATGLGRRALRGLRRRSAVPVSTALAGFTEP
jgi:hypothetical protein